MSRPPRILFTGAWYHVMNRGRRKEPVFIDKGAPGAFLELLRESAARFEVSVNAYCLLENHYHLLVQTAKPNLPDFMKRVGAVFTQRVNSRFDWDGALFRGRYKAILVQNDPYLLEVVRYIHRNPLRSGASSSLEDHEHSSHHAYLSKASKWNWVETEPLLNMLDPKPARQRSAYLSFMNQPLPEFVRLFYERKSLRSVLGSSEFLQRIKDGISDRLGKPGPIWQGAVTPDIERVKSTAARAFDVDPGSIMQSVPGRLNKARLCAIYLSKKLCRLPHDAIATAFGMTSSMSVSMGVLRAKRRMEQDHEFGRMVHQVERAVLEYV